MPLFKPYLTNELNTVVEILILVQDFIADHDQVVFHGNDIKRNNIFKVI